MAVSLSRRDFIQVSAASSLGFIAGCGMILHPERRNQPPGGGIDWGVFALDSVGLLLFFIPGVIAFAVDFSTGAIYLPPPGYGEAGPAAKDRPLVALRVPRTELTQRKVEEVASQQAGRDVRLVAGEYRSAPLAKLEEFWPTRARLAGLFG